MKFMQNNKQFHAWYMVAILSVVHGIAILDRFLVGIVAEALKAEMLLSDAQLGFIMGPAFLIFYCCFAVPMGLYADSFSRRALIALGMCAWSLAGVAFATAESFTMLVVARSFVGMGEACLLPAAMSMISACFPAAKLGRAISLFSLGASLGKVVAFMGGGTFLAFLISLNPDARALFGVTPWRALFFYAVIPGLILAAVMFTVREPSREAAIESKLVLLKAALLQLKSNIRTYACLFVGGSAFAGMSLVLASWAVSYFLRVHQLSVAEAGTLVGSISLLAGVSGTVTSGWLTDKLSARGVQSAPITVMAIFLLLIALFSLNFFFNAGNTTFAILGYGALQFCLAAGPPAYLTGLQIVTPENCRATVLSIALVFVTLIGGSIGPTVVGVMTDRVFTDTDGIASALTVASMLFGLIGGATVIIGHKVFIQSRLKVSPIKV